MSTRTAIITAMQEELDPLLKIAKISSHEKNKKIDIWNATLFDVPVLFGLTGIGKVNAAIGTECLLSKYEVSQLINVGVAGSTADHVRVGDICFANKLIQSDFDLTLFGYKRGEIPKLGTDAISAHFNKDRINSIKSLFKKNTLHLGPILSADQFVTDRKKILSIGKVFSAVAKDMESAAIGHACYLNHVPCTVIRGISDNSADDAEEEYENNLQLAIDNSIQAFINYFQKL